MKYQWMVFEINRVICLIVMFSPRVAIIKIQKMTHFLQFEQNIYVRLKDLIEFFPKMVWLIGFGVTVREIFRVEISKKLLSQKKEIQKPFLFKSWHLANGSRKSSNPQHFLKKLNDIFQMHINILPKLRMTFFLS